MFLDLNFDITTTTVAIGVVILYFIASVISLYVTFWAHKRNIPSFPDVESLIAIRLLEKAMDYNHIASIDNNGKRIPTSRRLELLLAELAFLRDDVLALNHEQGRVASALADVSSALDESGVPIKDNDGQPFALSQRIRILTGAQEAPF